MNDKHKIIGQLTEIETRWFGFLAKLEERMQELSEASIPELEDLYKNDEDQFKRTYERLLSSIIGQLNSVENKADEIEAKNVNKPLDRIENKVNDTDDDDLKEFFDNLSERCSKRADEFEEKVEYWIEKVKETGKEDFEIKYQAIIDEYNTIKDKFCCKQCGSPITINKVLFITTHLSCPACQTQNTFVPSSQASDLDYVGLCLAEQRTKHILIAYEKENDKERDLYNQMHTIEIEKIGYEINGDNSKLPELDSKIKELEIQRKASVAKAPELYQEYLTAKFEEWIKLVPELAEQNQKIYESWLNNFIKKER